MIRTIIVEDEKLIAEEFRRMLMRCSGEMEILGSFDNIKDTVSYLSANESPDLIFSDVQLRDGLSFEIFNQVKVKSPVVFITAYDHFILNAFESNGIDYILKPVEERDIEKTLLKYKALENHFAAPVSFFKNLFKKYRNRLMVKRGIEYIALRTTDIVLIYTENKLMYVIDREGKKYITDKNLAELEDELDPSMFFRANRQYMINITYVKSFKVYEKVKLQIDLTMPEIQRQIIVSQEMAPCFRRWISEL